MVGRALGICALAVMLVGCARAPGQRPEATRQPESSTPADASVASQSAADVAQVVCEKDAVRLVDPVVRPHPDGVHLLVENPGGAWGVDLHHESWASGTGEGFRLTGETTTDTSAMGPGSVTVACVPNGEASYSDPGVPTAKLTIVDPDGLYTPWDLTCGFGEQFRMKIAATADEDPVSVFRRVPGVMSSDVLKPPNYPGSPQYWPTETVLREGEPIARIGAPIQGSEWELLINACPDSGIHK